MCRLNLFKISMTRFEFGHVRSMELFTVRSNGVKMKSFSCISFYLSIISDTMMRSQYPIICYKCPTTLLRSAIHFVNYNPRNPGPHFGSGFCTANNTSEIVAFLVIIEPKLCIGCEGRSLRLVGKFCVG